MKKAILSFVVVILCAAGCARHTKARGTPPPPTPSISMLDAALWKTGTTAGTTVNLEDCSGCGESGWGWQDNGYGAGVLGQPVRFPTSGSHRLVVQIREDGFSIDQIVLSSGKYVSTPPGGLKTDTTILPECANPPLR